LKFGLKKAADEKNLNHIVINVIKENQCYLKKYFKQFNFDVQNSFNQTNTQLEV
jgi:hypothetical protein